MMLVFHIVIALFSIVLATYAFFKRNRGALYFSYGAVGVTLITGFMLVIWVPSHIMQACMSGLLYVGIVSLALIAAKQRITVNEKTVK